MSVRKLIVQYVGDVLLLPKLERGVMRVYERDRIGRTVREYVPIVRCRDCKYALHFWHHDDERWQCTNEMLEGLDVSPSFYCAWGERREQ